MEKQSGQIRILHVEDVARDSELTRLFLEEKGLGLEMLENENFDVVISDYMMTEMNGLEFLVELRTRGNNIPFIIFTGRGDEEVAMDALNNFPLDKLEEKKIIERDFSKERKSFIFHIAEGMEGLFRGPTISRELLTRFLKLAERFKANR